MRITWPPNVNSCNQSGRRGPYETIFPNFPCKTRFEWSLVFISKPPVFPSGAQNGSRNGTKAHSFPEALLLERDLKLDGSIQDPVQALNKSSGVLQRYAFQQQGLIKEKPCCVVHLAVAGVCEQLFNDLVIGIDL